MLTLTFKNVGQGDCIIIDWREKGAHKMGVIDCHAPGGSYNPVIEHIEKHRFREIDFLVLSHPHYDHYSGLGRILEHCMGQRIVIRRFGHTARAAPAYIRAVVMSDEKKRSLVKLFTLVRELEASGLIVDRGLITDQVRPIPLGERVSLSFLAPSDAEYDEYLKSLYDDDMDLKSSPNANWLCTVGMVEHSEWYALLTADAEISTQRRIGIRILRKDSRTMVLGQLPHHGSEGSFYREFWKRRVHQPQTPIAISVGPNTYGHPSRAVISSLRGLDYKVEITGSVNMASTRNVRAALGVVSRPRLSNLPEGNDLHYRLV